MKWYKVADALPTGQPFIRKAKAGSHTICIINYNDELSAVSARCPHAGGDLSHGWCKDGKIVCPLHRYQYDLKTGKGDPGQNDYIDSYPVEIRDDGVYVGITSFWGRIFQ